MPLPRVSTRMSGTTCFRRLNVGSGTGLAISPQFHRRTRKAFRGSHHDHYAHDHAHRK